MLVYLYLPLETPQEINNFLRYASFYLPQTTRKITFLEVSALTELYRQTEGDVEGWRGNRVRADKDNGRARYNNKSFKRPS